MRVAPVSCLSASFQVRNALPRLRWTQASAEQRGEVVSVRPAGAILGCAALAAAAAGWVDPAFAVIEGLEGEPNLLSDFYVRHPGRPAPFFIRFSRHASRWKRSPVRLSCGPCMLT